MAPHPLLRLLVDDEGRSIVEGLRSGRAGAVVRAGLSVAAAAVCLAAGLLVLGLYEGAGGSVGGGHIGIMAAGAAVLWSVCLVLVWWGYRRFPSVVRTVVAVLAVWAVTMPVVVVLVESGLPSDFIVVAVVVGAIGTTLMLVVMGFHRATAGRLAVDRLGTVVVRCPACRYSMVGLKSTTCPECGTRFTIDQIIDAQNYGVAPGSEGSPEPAEAAALPPALAHADPAAG